MDVRTRRQVIFILAVLAVASLVFSTIGMIKVSSWLVQRDHIIGKMHDDGFSTEAGFAAAFTVAGNLYIPVVEIAVGAVFLLLLWRELFSQSDPAHVQLDGSGSTKPVESTG